MTNSSYTSDHNPFERPNPNDNVPRERYQPEQQGELWGIRDTQTGDWIVAPKCEEISFDYGSIFTNGIGWFFKDGKFGIINHDGEISQMLFEEILSDCHGPVIIQHNGNKGYIDEKGMFAEHVEHAYFEYEI